MNKRRSTIFWYIHVLSLYLNSTIKGEKMLSWYFICYDYVWCEFQIYFHFMILGFGVLENFLRSPLFYTYTKNMIAYVLLKIFHSHTRKIVFLLSYNITIIPIILRGRVHVIKFHHIFMTRYFIIPSQQQFCRAL